jgi:hypothetical protein
VMSRDIEDKPDLHQGPVLFVLRGLWVVEGSTTVKEPMPTEHDHDFWLLR